MKESKLIRKGKTKDVMSDPENPDQVVLVNRNEITKNDNPSQTKKMQGKAEFATIVTCIIFEVLRLAGIPLAYIKQLGPISFLAKRCKMIPLEVVVRRYAVGSYLARNPDLKREGNIPYGFEHVPCVEIFLKTTNGVILSKDGRKIGQLPIDPETKRPIDDPLILDPDSKKWELYHPKKPISKETYLYTVFRDDILPQGVSMWNMQMIACKTFTILEDFLGLVELHLIDFKVEFGIGPKGELLLADVIDNDSWRLRTWDWKEEVSKELFRQGKDLETVKKGYEFVVKSVKDAYEIYLHKH